MLSPGVCPYGMQMGCLCGVLADENHDQCVFQEWYSVIRLDLGVCVCVCVGVGVLCVCTHAGVIIALISKNNY